MKEISCNEVRELISPYLDGYTGDRETEILEHHIKYCMPCAEEIEACQKISGSLLQLNNIACPDNFTGLVMSRLKESEPVKLPLRERLASRFGAAQKALAAAAAAALIMAGSAGINAGYRFVADNNEPVPGPPQQRYEVVVNNGGGTGPEKAAPAEAPPEPETNDNAPAGSPAAPANGDSKPAAGNTGTAAAASGAGVATGADGEPAVLLNHNTGEIVIESSILKVAVNSADEARQRALSLAGSYGGNAQPLGSQNHNDKVVHIVHITVPKSNAPGLLAGLAGLGTELDRQHERQNKTAQYRELADRHNELLGLKESGAADLDGQIAAAREQLNNWTGEADNYTIVLWLEE